jgi:hypothetical protein
MSPHTGAFAVTRTIGCGLETTGAWGAWACAEADANSPLPAPRDTDSCSAGWTGVFEALTV